MVNYSENIKMNSRFWIIGVSLFLFLVGCNSDDALEVPVEDFQSESFPDLTLDEFGALEAPFESVIQVSSPGVQNYRK